MAITEIIPSTAEHAAYIAERVRPEDAEELWASSYAKPLGVMLDGIKYSDFAYTGMVDGEPVCMFGVLSEGFIGSVGIPWMVGSRLLDKHAKLFLLKCRRHFVEMFVGYDRLLNYVDARNVRAIAWLGFMGFTVEPEAKPYGVLGLPFRKFWMEK